MAPKEGVLIKELNEASHERLKTLTLNKVAQCLPYTSVRPSIRPLVYHILYIKYEFLFLKICGFSPFQKNNIINMTFNTCFPCDFESF